MRITASSVSRTLGKHHDRFQDVYEHGRHVLLPGFKVIQPSSWHPQHGAAVYVRYMGGKPGPHRSEMLDRYTQILEFYGFTVERRHDTLYVSKP